ncbi:MAG: cell wall protein [Myxococcaceae bacterium]|nr:cell wall protein [Myxococcaceae bacterium]
MSTVDQFLRSIVQAEVERAVAPLAAALEAQQEVLGRFAAAFGAPLKRGPGRPKKLSLLPAVKVVRGGATKVRASSEQRLCAVMGCKRPARAKGYCAAHYQKFRMLKETGRLPSDWVEDAEPQSVKNIVLPRGRAGAKALAEAKKKG